MEETSFFERVHGLLNRFSRYRFMLSGFVMVALLLATMYTVSVVSNPRLLETRSRAALTTNDTGNHVTFLDSSGNPTTQTQQPSVSVRLQSPWGIQQNGVLGQNAVMLQVKAASDDVNQDGANLTDSSSRMWIGTGQSTSSSWTGLRFPNIQIPRGARIDSSQIEVFAAQSTWIQLSFTIAAHNMGNSPTFSATNKPSTRALTTTKINHQSNQKWDANKWYRLNEMRTVIQEIVNRSDWQPGNSISIILKGSGAAFGRKMINSFEGGQANAPRLLVTYTTPDTTGSPTATSVPQPTATPLPSSTPVPTTRPTARSAPTPTPLPVTTSVDLAEDAGFSKNFITLPYTSHPMTLTYTFSDPTPGVKTLYVRFISSTAQSQVVTDSIELLAPPTPTPTPGTVSQGQNSMAMGRWVPNSKYDTCTVAEHDSYKVQGPDGKWYPTWHPPVHTRADGSTCTFGHEHGRDPKGSAVWSLIQQTYGYDANRNGSVDGAELATAGLPFGYANEKLDEWNTAKGITNGMRHEDHVGHKIEWENNVQRTTSPNYLPSSPANDFGKVPTSVYCDFLMKPHQGTHSKDAFTNNLHELGYFAQCRDAIGGGIGTQIAIMKMSIFGVKGGFTNRGPAGSGTNGARVEVGTATPPNGPDTADPSRLIPTIDSVKNYILVPSGQWSLYSEGIYEDWISNNYIRSSSNDWIVYFDPHFAVFSPSRFYWSGSDPESYGLTRTAEDKANNLGRSVDICKMVENGSEKYRGGECDYMTNYGQIKDIAWDDPRSVFNGIHREMYFNQNGVKNNGGVTRWYSDPFGNNASTTPFPGAVQHFISSVNNERKNDQGFIDPNGRNFPFESEAIGSTRNYGGNGVHAPN